MPEEADALKRNKASAPPKPFSTFAIRGPQIQILLASWGAVDKVRARTGPGLGIVEPLTNFARRDTMVRLYMTRKRSEQSYD